MEVKQYWYENDNLHIIDANGNYSILYNPYIQNIQYHGLDIQFNENITLCANTRPSGGNPDGR